jgi:(p)ppGpp synthase/HD superfamily hydrolase
MNNNWTQEAYIKAYKFAAIAHKNQKVPYTKIPYLQHLSFVSMEIIAALNVEQERDGNLAVQCAILHDVIEDTSVTFNQIKDEFGLSVGDTPTPTASSMV